MLKFLILIIGLTPQLAGATTIAFRSDSATIYVSDKPSERSYPARLLYNELSTPEVLNTKRASIRDAAGRDVLTFACEKTPDSRGNSENDHFFCTIGINSSQYARIDRAQKHASVSLDVSEFEGLFGFLGSANRGLNISDRSGFGLSIYVDAEGVPYALVVAAECAYDRCD